MKKYLIYTVLLLFFGSCSVQFELGQQNLAFLYKEETNAMYFRNRVFHVNDSITEVFVRLNLGDFAYLRTDSLSTSMAKIRMSWFLYPDYESKEPLSSGSLLIVDSLHAGMDFKITRQLRLYARFPGEYLISLEITDLNNNRNDIRFIPLFKTDRSSCQFYLAHDEEGNILFDNYMGFPTSVYVSTPDSLCRQFTGSYYCRDFPIALPPYALDNGEPFDYLPDSTFTIVVANGKSANLRPEKHGFYHLRCDTASREGFTIFMMEEDFPILSRPEHILRPLRYLTTQREYERLCKQPDIKLAVDSFWLENAGNIDRARSVVSKYYKRVQQANFLFTSYLEGWKTDRGMIYIVFGPPNLVYRGINTESWVYGEAANPKSIRFNFIRVNNPFTYNDFSLFRNPSLKEAWFNAVDNWRR